MVPSLLCFWAGRRQGMDKILPAISSPLPGQTRTQADENQPGEPLLESRQAGIAAKQLTQRSSGVGHTEIDQRAADVEDQAEHQDLPDYIAAVRIDKLGKKGKEEESNFRIEHIRDHALAKNGGQAIRLKLLCGEITALHKHLDTKIDQVRSARVANHVEDDRRRTQKSGKAECGGKNMRPAANKNAERGDNARFASLAKAAANDVKHVRAGRNVEHECGEEKRQEGGFFRHSVFG
jgi:hypothetical protein